MKKIFIRVRNILSMIIPVLAILSIMYGLSKLKTLLLVLFIAYNVLSAICNIAEWKIKKEDRYTFLAISNIIILFGVALYLSNYYSIKAYLRSRQ